MSPWKRWAVPVGGLLLSVLLSGCFVQPADSLYALPRQSDAYYDLQNAIDAALPADAAYSGPLSGPNQQAVQLADLDGDGEDEALVFAKTSGEKPLKIYIFDAEDDSFVQTAVIEGDGTAFDAVEYVPVDDTPGMEIILGRQLSDQILQSLSVYSYSDGTAAELMHAAYTEYKVVDLNLDDRRDVLIFRQDTETRQGMAEYYTWEDGVMERRQTAALSKDIHTIERIVTGYVTADIPGAFVTSTYGEDALVTDVFAFRGQTFSNLTLSAESGVSTQLVRSYQVFATDIDEDGVVELPTLVALPSATAGEDTYWLVEWYSLQTDGVGRKKETTFYYTPGGWYLTVPESWTDQLTVSRTTEDSQCLRYTFSQWTGRDQTPQEILSIFALTGEDRLTRAQSEGKFLLGEKGDVAYAAQLGESALAKTLTEASVQAMFHRIKTDWNSGET